MMENILRRVLRAVFGGGADISAANPLEVHDPKVGSLISYEGTTDADGNPGGTTLECSGLIAEADFDGNEVIITSGPYAGQARGITGATDVAGIVTVPTAFDGQILSGTSFVIAALRLTPAEVAAIEAKLDHAGYGLEAIAGALADIKEITGTDLEAKLDALYPYHGLVHYGMVTGITGAPKFQCEGLVGFGDDYFKGYWSYVVWDTPGGGAAPQGEMLECTGYTSATGDFTVAAYTAPIAIGDRVLLLHPAIASLINTTYGLPAIKPLIDAVEVKLDAGGLGAGLVTKALTFADNTGQVPLFTVTGDVIVRIVAVVKTTCASGGCNVSVGIATDVDAIIPVTDITLLAAQEIWHDATPDSEIEALGTIREHIVTGGNNITLNSDAADNSGAITFYCFWTALSSGATVVAA